MNAALVPPAPSPPPLRAPSYRLTAPNSSTCARVLRELVCCLLKVSGHAGLLDDARLCVSEVVTNVHRHTRTRLVVVDVSLGAERVTVAVYDDAAHKLPVVAKPGPDIPCGRGLALVHHCSDGWGATQYGGPIPSTKAVWFHFDLRRRGAAP
ncbi:ATP-binding protein [Streptomyces sp. G45]|uniref:ATP-binding protein n=1 Tax=Streptomyces sp. G45 TaxID=3406627 RepID=UPI003C205E8F